MTAPTTAALNSRELDGSDTSGQAGSLSAHRGRWPISGTATTDEHQTQRRPHQEHQHRREAQEQPSEAGRQQYSQEARLQGEAPATVLGGHGDRAHGRPTVGPGHGAAV